MKHEFSKLQRCFTVSYDFLLTMVHNWQPVKLGFQELFNKEQIGNSEPFPVTNLPFDLTNSEQIGISEQFCGDQKVS